MTAFTLCSLEDLVEEEQALFTTVLKECDGQPVLMIAELGLNLVNLAMRNLDKEEGRALLDAITQMKGLCEMEYSKFIHDTAIDPHGRRLN